MLDAGNRYRIGQPHTETHSESWKSGSNYHAFQFHLGSIMVSILAVHEGSETERTAGLLLRSAPRYLSLRY